MKLTTVWPFVNNICQSFSEYHVYFHNLELKIDHTCITPIDDCGVAENPTDPSAMLLNWERRYSTGPSGLICRILCQRIHTEHITHSRSLAYPFR